MKNKKNFVIYKNFFNKKRILITGNTGFVGSNLSIALKLMGSKILGYSLKKKIQDIYRIMQNIERKSKLFMVI